MVFSGYFTFSILKSDFRESKKPYFQNTFSAETFLEPISFSKVVFLIVFRGRLTHRNKICILENTRRFTYKEKSSTSEFYPKQSQDSVKTQAENCQATVKNGLPLTFT